MITKPLSEDNHLRLAPAQEWQAISVNDRFSWCVAHARYGIPTQELIAWLQERIAGRRAIEIGAGMGDLGRHLGIPMTDSAIQEEPGVALYYAALGHTTIKPPADVVRLDAKDAVRKYKPRVVIGSWITQLYKPGDEGPPKVGSSVYGVDELRMMETWPVETYIHIGNQATHGDKRLLALPHKTFTPSWLVSRSLRPEDNVIYVWDRTTL